jgi:hypothetical protein
MKIHFSFYIDDQGGAVQSKIMLPDLSTMLIPSIQIYFVVSSATIAGYPSTQVLSSPLSLPTFSDPPASSATLSFYL